MNLNWWQTMVFVVLVFAGGFFTSRWTTVVPPPKLLPGTHTVDTEYVEIPPVSGSTTVTVKKTSEKMESDSSQQKPELPSEFVSEASLYETEVDTIQNGVHVNIRATSYVLSKDSVLQTLEYNVQPRPIQNIVKTDTIYVMKEVPVPAKPAFFEKPAVAYVVGGIVGGAIVIAIRKLTE